ncbi:MAG: DNA polymerase III subunit gamma/tau [Pirellulaceae bacterium]
MAYLFHPTKALYPLPGAATMSNNEGASDVSEFASDGAAVSESSGSYVVVARRYRPRAFSEVIGQQPIARALTNAIETQRVGHAYLFTGARGVGKTSMARILAKALNAPAGPTVAPGDDSDICQAIDAGEDVDVLEIDGASNRGIDEIRQLRSNANVRPSRARYKIYIIDEVHMLTPAAFNALLKTLEEPPGHVKFILCTTDPQKIPITVLSRCQRYDFAPVDVPSIVQRLEQIVASEQRQADPEALRLLARRAEGSMRDSQSLLEQLLAYCSGAISVDDVHQMLGTAGSKQLTSFVNLLANRDAASALAALDEAVAAGVDCGQFAEQLLGHVRDMMACQVGCGPELMRHSDATEHDTLLATGNQFGLKTALAAFEILDHMVSRMRQSVQPRVLLEIAIVRICHLEDLEQLSSLIAQLENGSVSSSQGSSRGATDAGSGSSRTPATSQSESRSAPAASRPGAAEKKKPEAVSQPRDEPASPVAARQLTAETADGIWRQVLEQLGDMTADFASYYDHVATTAPDSLVVHFRERYTLQKESCEQAERKAQLERTLAQIVGRRVRIDMAVVPDPESEQTRAPTPSILQVTREKENDPFVRQAVELFDAEVVKVHVPRNSRSRGP